LKAIQFAVVFYDQGAIYLYLEIYGWNRLRSVLF
jgi:hypothetical protein